MTGATGLLGEYLLKDLLIAGQDLAVLVRPCRGERGRIRIEALLRRWEQITGHLLPRPVVLEGDLSRPNLGLDENQLDWIREHCDRVLHNAASLTFIGAKGREPWVTNLLGTQSLLDVCQRTGIRQFHHVSTAYVCGKRRDTILESQFDVGQSFGNDYENSKFEAESLVRNASFLDRFTIYRPAIIVGDSQSGYTSSYHGFYLPLKIVFTMLKHVQRVEIQPGRLMSALQLLGTECKNLVPVDWVSALISHVFVNRCLHGKTYHVTPRERVNSKLICDVMERAIKKNLAPAQQIPGRAKDYKLPEFEAFFEENMRVYQAYWGDDPQFDCTNLLAGAPHLPCPHLDEGVLISLCKFAIRNNFGSKLWPAKSTETSPLFEDELIWPKSLASSPLAQSAKQNQEDRTRVGIRVSGPGGGQWTAHMNSGTVALATGVFPDPDITFHANSSTIRDILNQQRSADDCLACGEILYEGTPRPFSETRQMLQNVLRI
jgi:nucleoside-diphosphate-sugar epimerase